MDIDDKNAVCKPYNKSNSEVLEIKYVLEECNYQAPTNGELQTAVNLWVSDNAAALETYQKMNPDTGYIFGPRFWSIAHRL